MCKNCVLLLYKQVIGMVKTNHYSICSSLNINEMSKTRVYTQSCEPTIRKLMNIKFSLNTLLNINLSTISTHPTITTTKLILNIIVINKSLIKGFGTTS